MKKMYLFLCFGAITMLQSQNEIFAITGEQKEGINFKDIRKIGNSDPKVLLNSGYQHKPSGVLGEAPIQPLIAALEVSENSEKLLYLPMVSSIYYVLDVKTRQVTAQKSDDIIVQGCDEGSFFSRMGRVADGSIYALNNNSTQLLRFVEKNGKFECEAVGYLNLVGNTFGKTLDDRDFSWGGDLIGDAFGNLYLISAYNHVFRIDPKRKEISFYAKIEGLPEGFTSNGVAALEDGKVLLASNGSNNALYSLDFSSSKAELFDENNSEKMYDLASPFLMNEKESQIANQLADVRNSIRVYPSIVENQQIVIDNDSKSDISVQIFDLNGQKISEGITKSKNRKQTLGLNQSKPGVYIVRVLDGNGNEIQNSKITVLR